MNTLPLSDRLKSMLVDLAEPTRNLDQAIVRETVLLLRDELRAREEEHRHTDDRYRLAVDAARIGVWDWDPASGRVTWNSHYSDIFGFPASQFQGTHDDLIRFAHPADVQKLSELLLAARRERLHLDHTFRIRKPDGSVRWIRTQGGCHYNADGGVIRMTGTAIDISDQVQWRMLAASEAKARARAEELSVMLEAVPAFTFLAHDAECRRISCSSATRKLLRVPEGFSVSKSAPSDKRPTSFRVFQGDVELADDELPLQMAARTGKEIRNVELRLKFEDATYRDIYGDAVPLFDDAGRVRGAVGSFTDITDRNVASRKLQASEERLRLALQAGKMGTWDWSLTTGQSEWNEEMYRQLGYAPGAVKAGYDAWAARILPADLAQAERQVSDSFERGGDYLCEYRVLDPDGQIRTLEGRCSTELNADGKPIRSYGVVIDVTAERNAAQQAHESERRVRGMLDSLPEHIAVLDAGGVIEFVNASWRSFAATNGGAAPVVSVGVNYLSVCRRSAASGDEIAGRCADLLDEVLGGRRDDFAMEYPCHAAGERRWFVMHARRYGDGTSGAIISHVDITARKLAEENIRASEARLAAALEGGRMGLWEWNLNDNHSVWNATEYELLGLPVGEGNVPTNLFFDRVHPDDAGPLNRVLSDVMKAGSEFYHEVRIRRADGQERWLAAAGKLIRDASGKPRTMIGVNYDITRRKLIEEQLGEAKRIAEQAKAAAEGANASKDKFLAMLSHELRTPLTPVLTATELLQSDSTLSADSQECVQMIRRNVEIEMRLIDDLLDITRISRDKLVLQPRRLNVHLEISIAVRSFRHEASAKLLLIETSLDADEHHIEADPSRFQQVIRNLISNSIKFTPASGRIAIRTSNTDANELRIEVIDTGVGIAPEVLPTVFNAFEQGGRETTRQFGGLGLGLAICKTITELHQGRIVATSQGAGKGATFTLHFPISAIPKPVAKIKPPRPLAELNCAILLVEDDDDSRRMLGRLLLRIGCKVETAGTVADALRLAKAQKFDVVISDISLPDATGLDLMREFKSRYEIKGIALTGHGAEDDVDKSKAAGFEAHLTKPIDFFTLKKTLHQITELF